MFNSIFVQCTHAQEDRPYMSHIGDISKQNNIVYFVMLIRGKLGVRSFLKDFNKNMQDMSFPAWIRERKIPRSVISSV